MRAPGRRGSSRIGTARVAIWEQRSWSAPAAGETILGGDNGPIAGALYLFEHLIFDPPQDLAPMTRALSTPQCRVSNRDGQDRPGQRAATICRHGPMCRARLFGFLAMPCRS